MKDPKPPKTRTNLELPTELYTKYKEITKEKGQSIHTALISHMKETIGMHQTPSIDIPTDFVKFNELIGLPKHPATGQAMKLMPYQEQFFDLVNNSKHRKFHVNKARQIGFTELILRILAFYSFNRYAEGKIMIIAGTRERTAKKIMHRFQELFRNIPQVIQSQSDLLMTLINGTMIEALPSSSDAIRGDTKIKAIFLDESAHFKLIDDSVVMDAINPIVETNQSDLFIISTPNGKRGFFWNISNTDNDFVKKQYDIHVAEGWIYTKEQAGIMLESKLVDVAQEYLNQYTSPRDSIFNFPFTEEQYEAERF